MEDVNELGQNNIKEIETQKLYRVRNVTTVVILILSLILILYIYKNFNYFSISNKSNINSENTTISPESREKIKFQAMMSEIITSRDFKQCDKISDSVYKIICINSIALELVSETGDISYCDRLDDVKASKEDCRNETPFKSSLKNENIKICNQLLDSKTRDKCINSFYEVLARYKDDITICNSYSGEMLSLCRDRFIVMKALSHPRESISCTQVTDEALRADCELLVKPRTAFSDMTTSTCQSFKSDFMKQGCNSLNTINSSSSNTIGIYP